MAGALPRMPPACGLRLATAMALLKGPPACGQPGQQRLVVVLADFLKRTVYSSYSRGGSAWIAEPPTPGGVACVGALGSGFAPERFHDLSNGLL